MVDGNKLIGDVMASAAGAWALLAAAEVDYSQVGEKITTYGLLAAVVYWMMQRQTKAIDDLTSSVDKLHDLVQTNPCRWGKEQK